eukprot:759832-Hanusia_phi.AAC.2
MRRRRRRRRRKGPGSRTNSLLSKSSRRTVDSLYEDLGPIEPPARPSTAIDPFASPLVRVEEVDDMPARQTKKLQGLGVFRWMFC